MMKEKKCSKTVRDICRHIRKQYSVMEAGMKRLLGNLIF